jgi:hypothetical protein
MLILDPEYRRTHGLWMLGTALAALAALVWYLIYGYSRGSWSWPSGASPPGFAFGVLGGGIILFEMLLWPRKAWWRGWRLGRTKVWMMAHIWLGLLTLPLLLLHGSFLFDLNRSTLAAVLLWLLVVVVGSGLFGLVIQNVVPRLILENVPAETIHSQIGHVLEEYLEEADGLVAATCGKAPERGADRERAPERSAMDRASFVSVGTMRQVGRVQGKVIEAGVEAVWVPDSEALFKFHEDQVAPYLRAKSGGKLALGRAQQAAAMFRSLKTHLRAEAHPVVDHLAVLCEQRRQFDIQARLHNWLHAWVGVHVALSVALVLLMVVHVVMALKYV